MRTGAWTAACLLLTVLAKTAPALPAEVFPVPNNQFAIPINIDPARKAEIQGLELFVSTDQGKTWSQRGSATTEQKEFNFTAEVDGEYWFSVIILDRKGNREPPHPSAAPVGQKILVDTLKPEVKMRAERQGDSVNVNWEIREEHPNLNSFKLEWRAADGPETWVPVQVSPGLTGHASIRASEAIVVRGSLEDLAKNLGKDEAKVPAAAGSVTAMGPGLASPVAPVTTPGSGLPHAITGDDPLWRGPIAGVTLGTDSASSIRRVSTAPPPSKVGVTPTGPEEIGGLHPPLPSATTVPSVLDHSTPESIAVTPPVTPLSPVGPPVMPVTPPPALDKPLSATGGNVPSVIPPVEPAPAPSNGKNDLQVINTRRVTMEYEVSKVGPSGVGSVDVYLTRNDGMKWDKVNAEHQAVGGETTPGLMRRTLTVDLAEDGIYGFFLVAKSGAGISKPEPRSGLDVPQMRVKLDTTLPVANLFKPEKDKAHPDALVIGWQASDENLASNPVSLQWAEKPAGPWQNIGPAQMPNTGSFSWQVPANIPPNVYLRLTVRDSAGNVAIAETKEAVSIDLNEPSVQIRGLVGIQPH